MWPLRGGGDEAKGRDRNGKGGRGKRGGKLEQGRRMAKAGPATVTSTIPTIPTTTLHRDQFVLL